MIALVAGKLKMQRNSPSIVNLKSLVIVKLRSSAKLDSLELANSQEHGCFYQTAFGGHMNPLYQSFLMIFIYSSESVK